MWFFSCIACDGSIANNAECWSKKCRGVWKRASTRFTCILGHWARKLSWKESAEKFRTSWDKVHDAVEYLVTWGLEHRVLGAIRAIGVDEIQRGKGHKYLTLVYQIDLGCTRLLWIGKERTVKTFKEFFTMIGHGGRRKSSSSARTFRNCIWV